MDTSRPSKALQPGEPDLVCPRTDGGRGRALPALGLLVPVPALSVLLAMMVPGIEGTLGAKVIYLGAKVWTCLLPVAWLLLVDRGRLSLSPARRGGLGMGVMLGAVTFAVIMAAYFTYDSFRSIPDTIRAEAVNNGIATPLVYIAFVCGLSLTNSLLEEYIWRWFVFHKCEVLIGPAGAVFLSAGLFTIHHVIALRAQADWTLTLIGSAGCFIGGVMWSWLYLRYRSIWPGYIAHVFADAAIYIIGWRLIFGEA